MCVGRPGGEGGGGAAGPLLLAGRCLCRPGRPPGLVKWSRLVQNEGVGVAPRRYMGLKQPRLHGDSYYEIIDEFVHAVMGRWPKAVLQVGPAGLLGLLGLLACWACWACWPGRRGSAEQEHSAPGGLRTSSRIPPLHATPRACLLLPCPNPPPPCPRLPRTV